MGATTSGMRAEDEDNGHQHDHDRQQAPGPLRHAVEPVRDHRLFLEWQVRIEGGNDR